MTMFLICLLHALLTVPLGKLLIWLADKGFRDEEFNDGKLTVGWACILFIIGLIPVLNTLAIIVGVVLSVVAAVCWLYNSTDIWSRDLW